MALDPLAARQRLEQRTIEATNGAMIDVLRGCLLAQAGEPQPSHQPLAVAFQRLALDQHGQAVLEAEVRGIGVAPLLLEGAGHAGEAEFAQRSVVGWVSMMLFSMVVAAAADVFVLDRQLVGHGFGAKCAVQAVLQDRLHRAVGAGADVHAALAGGLQPLGPVAADQAQDPQTGAEPLLGMRLGGQDPLDQRDGGRADRLGLAQQPAGRPFGVAAVRARHVIGDRGVPVRPGVTDMAGDPLTLVEQLDGLVGDPRLDHLAHQAIRHRIKKPVHLDEVIHARPAATPFRVGIRRVRHRQKGLALDRLEQRAAGGAEMAHGPVVQVGDQRADRTVQLCQGVEPAMTQPSQNTALDDLDANLDLGLVARLAHSGRQDRRAVMGRHVLVGPAGAGLVAAGRGDAGLEVVAHDLSGHASHAGERADMAADPVRQGLGPARLGIGEIGRAQHRHKDLRSPHLTRGAVDHLRRLPGIFDEQPLPGRVGLPHGWRQAAAPVACQIAEPAVAIAIRLPSPILLPQQQDGHAWRRSSAWMRVQSGGGRPGSGVNGGLNSLRSNAPSSNAAGTGPVLPTTAHRRRYSATA